MARSPRRGSGKTASKQTDLQKPEQPTRQPARKQQARKQKHGEVTAPGRVREAAAPAYGAAGEQWIAASEFKARCLELMDQVQDRRESVVITKHGIPVAQLVPYKQEEKRTFIGSMRGTVLWYGDIISPIDVEWDACADDEPEE